MSVYLHLYIIMYLPCFVWSNYRFIIYPSVCIYVSIDATLSMFLSIIYGSVYMFPHPTVCLMFLSEATRSRWRLWSAQCERQTSAAWWPWRRGTVTVSIRQTYSGKYEHHFEWGVLLGVPDHSDNSHGFSQAARLRVTNDDNGVFPSLRRRQCWVLRQLAAGALPASCPQRHA